jgi:hypothetical protein
VLLRRVQTLFPNAPRQLVVAAKTLAHAWRLVHGQGCKCVLVGQVVVGQVLVGQVLVGERMAEDDQVSV